MGENKPQEPAIRFKGFTDAWEQRKLEDVGTINPKALNTFFTVAKLGFPCLLRLLYKLTRCTSTSFAIFPIPYARATSSRASRKTSTSSLCIAVSK